MKDSKPGGVWGKKRIPTPNKRRGELGEKREASFIWKEGEGGEGRMGDKDDKRWGVLVEGGR